jgi:DNA-binding protein H-NS
MLGAGVDFSTYKAGDPAKKRGRKATKAAKPVGVIKYRNENGSTWVGRGKRPAWLTAAIAAGKPLEAFAAQ